jgi:hypothetical protein
MPERRTALLLRIRHGLKDQLADLAKREHRSLNQQIEFILEHFLSDTVKKLRNEQPGGEGRRGKNQGAD